MYWSVITIIIVVLLTFILTMIVLWNVKINKNIKKEIYHCLEELEISNPQYYTFDKKIYEELITELKTVLIDQRKKSKLKKSYVDGNHHQQVIQIVKNHYQNNEALKNNHLETEESIEIKKDETD